MSSAALEWLRDREALRQLMVDYFCGVDDRDFDRVAACFTPDVRADYGSLYEGREALIEFIRGVRFFHTTLHCMGGQLFEFAEDQARMTTWAMIAHHGRKGGGESFEYHSSEGRYVDVMRRRGGGWGVHQRGGEPVWPAVGAPAPDTDDPALRWLIDRALIRDLGVQWGLGMDMHDVARVRACVATDFCGDEEVDADAFAERAIARMGLHSTTHFLGVPVIDLDADSALVESSALVTERESGEPGKHPVLGFPVRVERTRSERWSDRLFRRDGRWWLAARGTAVPQVAARAAGPPTASDSATQDLIDRELIRDAIARSALEWDREDGATNHLVGNQEIDVHGDEARIRSYVYRTGPEDGGESHWGHGLHHWLDRLERRGGGWHILERRDVDLLAGP
jgi:hypothetical protein